MSILAWVYLFSIADNMTMPEMPSMPDMPRTWTVRAFGLMFTMWVVMMVGMMTPSAAPMILIYARVARQAALQGRPLAATGWFAGGYLLSWTGFSLAATAAQGMLESAALLTPMMEASSNRIGGVILIAAGVYQWSPLKDSCLTQCRSPFAFIQDHGGFKPGVRASLRLGLLHGLYCIGCCWILMALLFAGGVMNLLWIAAIAIFVLIEKVLRSGSRITRVAGIGLVVFGIWLEL